MIFIVFLTLFQDTNNPCIKIVSLKVTWFFNQAINQNFYLSKFLLIKIFFFKLQSQLLRLIPLNYSLIHKVSIFFFSTSIKLEDFLWTIFLSTTFFINNFFIDNFFIDNFFINDLSTYVINNLSVFFFSFFT